MKKILALVCAAMLCACCVALAACGGGSSSSAASGSASASAASDSSSASSAAAPANPADKFAGKWALVGAQNGNITLTGDFAEVFGEELDVYLEVNADGTAVLSYNGDQIDCNWELKDDNTISLTAANLEDTSGTKLFAGESIDVKYVTENNTLDIYDAESGAELIFSQTGAIEGMLDITTANGKPITSKDALVGTWRICGMNMQGVMMYGDADEIAEFMGGGADMSLTVNDDGTGTILGTDLTWTVDSNGAVITIEGVACPAYDFGNGDILVDISAGVGSTMYLVYAK